MDGIIYLFNQTGAALANADTEIQRLRARVADLEAEKATTE